MSFVGDPEAPAPAEMTEWPSAWRWTCPTCGRFIAASAVAERDYRDDSSYWGISTETTADCRRCGPVQPRWLPTRWVEATLSTAAPEPAEPSASTECWPGHDR